MKKIKKRLGDILIEKGFLSPKDLEQTLLEQKKSKRPLGEMLIKKGLIDFQQLDKTLQILEIKPLERYLPYLIIIFIVAGVLIGKLFPAVPREIGKMQIGDVVSIPITIVLFFMMFPIMLKVDFSNIKSVGKNVNVSLITFLMNWVVKPMVMYFFAWLFTVKMFGPYFGPTLASQYMTGRIIVGVAPCTAMVLMWSFLARGDLAFSVLTTALNVILILILYAPITNFLLGVAQVHVPFGTLFLCVFMYVGISLITGFFTRSILLKKKGLSWYNKDFLPKIDHFSSASLLVTLLIIFSTKGDLIMKMPATIGILALPLLAEFIVMFFITFAMFKFAKINYEIASVASLISPSNHFELGIATAIFIFGINSPVVLATVIVPLIEVPVMLAFVKFCLKNRYKTRTEYVSIKKVVSVSQGIGVETAVN